MDRRRLLLLVAALAAALGVALVFVWARGAESRAAEDYQPTPVVVVASEATVLPGESIASAFDSGKLVTQDVPQGQVLDGAFSASDVEANQDKIALSTLYPGEQLISAKVGGVGDAVDVAALPLPTGMLAKPESFELPVGSFILPGSQLAVFLTTDAARPTCLLIDRVTVISVGARTSETGAEDEQEEGGDGAPALHLAVTQEQFEQIEDGKTLGTLSVGLLNSESDVQVERNGQCASIRGAR